MAGVRLCSHYTVTMRFNEFSMKIPTRGMEQVIGPNAHITMVK